MLNLERDFDVIAEATSGKQAIELCEQLKPKIVLMDINMPLMNGVEATQIIHRKQPHIIIIAITAFRHEEMQQEMLRAGASGYITKDTDFADMITLIRTIIAGTTATTDSTATLFDLTNMELRILTLLAEGHDRQKIADMLTISINTVKMHFRNLYQKLGVANANDAIRVAIENNLIS
ncbi:MAG: response regulator transcription factor [Anaerolineae bacterium]|nr:response regulator transcription factor [Anaerolineae bacterium]